MRSDPKFVYFTADEGVRECVTDRARMIDHFRCLIAERAGDKATLKELRRLRGDPEGDADVEHAPWLIAIYQAMITWLAEAKPGHSFKTVGSGGTYMIFCVDTETLFDPRAKEEKT